MSIELLVTPAARPRHPDLPRSCLGSLVGANQSGMNMVPVMMALGPEDRGL